MNLAGAALPSACRRGQAHPLDLKSPPPLCTCKHYELKVQNNLVEMIDQDLVSLCTYQGSCLR